ncbi:hypothetical protein HHI36_019164 [Cryptolaemus montrouzieri]|uniref:Phosphatidic acid phosphatase type 2/haloperoxidase domain-containing protein n=1 Tax=Cryptolaemus montrouzieri TaxID=559131 RepID=A0ABD2P268_9CUCU
MSQANSRVPPMLKNLLELDKKVTKIFVEQANKYVSLRSLRVQYKALEISCHGIPWFAFWIAFTWLFDNPTLIEMQVNMLLGLLLDVIIIAVCKAYFRRRRPIANKDDALGQLGPDVFSFPSGHTSRAVFVAFFFTKLWPLPIIFIPPLLAWVSCVCISRVLMYRHYLLDILGGVFIGLLVGAIMSILWLNDSSAKFLMSFLSDEKLDGGEYHV